MGHVMGQGERQDIYGPRPGALLVWRLVRIEARTLWLAAAIIVVLSLGWLVVSKGLDALLLLFAAVVLAEGIRPLVCWLQGRGLPRAAAVLLIYLIMLGAVGGLLVDSCSRCSARARP